MAEEDIKRFTQTKFIEFIKTRLQNIIPAIINQVNLADTHPGLIVFKNNADELFKLALECGLCLHVATEPLQCDKCFQSYCEPCMKILIQAKTLIDQQKFDEYEDILLKPFICLNRCLQSKVIFGYDQRINSLKLKKFKCIYADCEFSQEWEQITNHIKKCTFKNQDVRVNISYLPYSYTHQFEKGYESKMEWAAYMQRDFELQFEQIKIEEKRPTFDPYPDGYAGYATSSEHLHDAPIPSTSQETNELKIATSSELDLKSPKHKKQKTVEIHYEIEEEEVCKNKIYRYHNLRTPKEKLEDITPSSFSIEQETPKYQMKKLERGK